MAALANIVTTANAKDQKMVTAFSNSSRTPSQGSSGLGSCSRAKEAITGPSACVPLTHGLDKANDNNHGKETTNTRGIEANKLCGRQADIHGMETINSRGMKDNKYRGTEAIGNRGIEANNCRGREASGVPLGRPMPQSLMDTPVKDLTDREFLWFCKLEAADLTPRQLLKQTRFACQFMVGSIPISYNNPAPEISKAKARRVRRAINKQRQLAAANATKEAEEAAINAAIMANQTPSLRVTVNNPTKTRLAKRWVTRVLEKQATTPQNSNSLPRQQTLKRVAEVAKKHPGKDQINGRLKVAHQSYKRAAGKGAAKTSRKNHP